MNTTLSIDKEIRDMANKRAKKEHISISAVARILLSDYANGHISIGVRESNKNNEYKYEEISVDKETQELMDKTILNWHNKKK